MKLTHPLYSLLLLSVPFACTQATFQSTDKQRMLPKNAPLVVDPLAKPDPISSTPIDGVPGTLDPKTLELIVTTPVNSVKAGGQKVQATATLKNQVEPPAVTWTITGPAGKTDIGTIDANGLYSSPATNDKEFPVTITATLKSDPSISASKTLTVLPTGAIFARCDTGTPDFPILAHVYSLPTTTTQLPDYNNAAQATKVTTVCMENYAVEPRNFDQGFPDLPNLYEWFSLQTTTNIVIPATGTYVFELNSDDGARLMIDGKEAINNDGLHRAFGTNPEDSQTSGKKEVTIQLNKGVHPLALNYFQGPKLRIALVLKWKKPGSTTFETVPRTSFQQEP